MAEPIDWQGLLGVVAGSLAEGVIVYDAEGASRAFNASAPRILALAPEDVPARSPLDPGHQAVRIDGSDAAGVEHPIFQALADGRPRENVRIGAPRLDGTWMWLSMNATPLRRPGEAEPYAVVTSFVDVTPQVEASERFRTLFEEAPIGMCMVSLGGRILEANTSLSDMIGHDRSTLEGAPAHRFLHPDDRDVDVELSRRLAEGALTRFSVERRLIRGDDSVVWGQIDVSLVRGVARRPASVIIQVQDITERRRLEAQMRHLADHDGLTGLVNRRAFGEALERHVAEVRRYGPAGALLLLDLDHFKDVNDTLGHRVGDEVLTTVAELLRERLRGTDVLGRLGGDEFAVLLLRADAHEALQVAIDLVALVRDRVALPGIGSGGVTASVGVAPFTEATTSGDQAMVDADLAMYAAKAAGRGRAVLFEQA